MLVDVVSLFDGMRKLTEVELGMAQPVRGMLTILDGHAFLHRPGGDSYADPVEAPMIEATTVRTGEMTLDVSGMQVPLNHYRDPFLLPQRWRCRVVVG